MRLLAAEVAEVEDHHRQDGDEQDRRERRGAAVIEELEHLLEHADRHHVVVIPPAADRVHDVEDLERRRFAMVVATVTIEPRMSGTITWKKIWRSLAPSSRAASRTSTETPLIAAERTTIAKPVWSQIMIRISAGMLIGNCRRPGDRLVRRTPVQIAFSEAELRLAGRLPGVHEPPDDRRADQRDRERREDEDLGQRLALDAVEERGDEQAQADADARRDDQPDRRCSAGSRGTAPVPRLAQFSRVNAPSSSWKLPMTVATAG